MNLTKGDLKAIKNLFDVSFDERVPKVVDEKVIKAIGSLKLEIGQFSLETTKRIDALDKKLSGKIDDLGERLEETTDMADTNRIEIAKIKRDLGMT